MPKPILQAVAAILRDVAAACVLGSIALAGGCAKPGPPGGGPIDTEPPDVVDTLPADGSVDVARDVNIEIVFSEEMNRPSVERNLSRVPPLELGAVRWRGKTLVLELAESIPESTTVVLEVGAAAQDYHNVLMGAPHSFAFSTGGGLDSGVIAGRVTAGGDPAAKATVWACLKGAEPDTSGFIHSCGYATSSDDEGAFRFENVASSGTAYTLVAFLDSNGDRRYWVAGETGGVVSEAALVDADGDSATGLVVPIEPPSTPSAAADQEEGT